MSNYSRIYIQIVFAVRNIHAHIKPAWEERLFQYITGIVQSKGQKMYAINGVEKPYSFFHQHQSKLLPIRFGKRNQKIKYCLYQRKQIVGLQISMARRFWRIFLRSFTSG